MNLKSGFLGLPILSHELQLNEYSGFAVKYPANWQSFIYKMFRYIKGIIWAMIKLSHLEELLYTAKRLLFNNTKASISVLAETLWMCC